MANPKVPSLAKLAGLYGVQTAYYGVDKCRRQASPEALLLVLRGLGAPVETIDDVSDAIRERQVELWKRSLEPVTVTWDGGPLSVELRLPSALGDSSPNCMIELEGAGSQGISCELKSKRPKQVSEVEGETYLTKELTLDAKLPPGYHKITLDIGGRILESTIISAPRNAYSDEVAGRAWGGFIPLYALHTQRSWGAGDFFDLEAFMDRIAKQGGRVVGTLPLLASYLDEPFDPSPYSPASRLFWNEFYIDVERLPELKHCPKARALLQSEETQRELEELRSSPLVDYRRQMALKRKILEELARSFFANGSERRASFEAFLKERPLAQDYARFRAVGEMKRLPWPEWPEKAKGGSINPEDYDEEVMRYYLYTQWAANEQILSLANKARGFGPGLYLDFPLGVNCHSYDTWLEREAFVQGISVGAPPDAFFTKGQNWGFPPLCPQKLRTQDYRYIINCLRHHLRAAGILRIDHVMGLHRLYWVPTGLEAADGVYVRYNAEELYAILSLESHRHKSWIVGENLGTVPYYVNPTMDRHNIFRMYVLQYELSSDRPRPVRAVGPDSVASLNTHDMPTFKAYWEGLDVEDRKELGLLNEAGARRERKNREAIKEALIRYLLGKGLINAPVSTESTLRACLAHLSESQARVILVNLEDLWLETDPQNVPGTFKERPNWKRKAAYNMEDFLELPEVIKTLQELNYRRKRGRGTQ
jgi:4-alpha-glucanotransferase